MLPILCKQLKRLDDGDNENGWSVLWHEALELAAEMEINMQTTVYSRKRKRNESHDFVFTCPTGHRPSVQTPDESHSISDNFRIHLLYPVLDRFINELNKRFTPETLSLINAIQALVLPTAENFLDYKSIRPMIDLFGSALQVDETLLKSELLIAKQIMSAHESPGNELHQILAHLPNDGSFIHLRTCIRVALTIPVSSASCERSFSTLRYIKNYLRNKMSDDRLSSLALLYINKQRTVTLNPFDIVDDFANDDDVCRAIALK